MASNEQMIWAFLKAQGLNDYGIAGLMGNLYAESGLSPRNLQNTYEKSLGYSDNAYTEAVDNGRYKEFVNDKAGYGLAQWTFWSRKQNLLNYAKEKGASIGDMNMQLEFLMKELGAYRLLDGLKTASSVLEASNLILLQFEKPQDQSENMQNLRAAYGQKYYDKYAKYVDNYASESAGLKGDVGIMSNSPLADFVILSPYFSRRTKKIDTVTIHCMAAVGASAEACGRLFQMEGKNASSNYGIGNDGKIGLYVEEDKASWCSSNSANDNRAITIEVANSGGAPDWPVSDAAYRSLIRLLVDICQRNEIKRLLWQGDKSLIGQVDKQNMTVHRWFAAKACPGNYLYNLHPQIADEVNKILQEKEDEDMTVERFGELMQEYRATLQDNDSGEWSREAREWAVKEGLIQGGGKLADGTPNYMWADQLSREQMVTLLYRFAKMIGKV